MSKHYAARKIDDQYVLVPVEQEHERDRVLWIAGGGWLSLVGLGRGGLTGTALVLLGGGLIFRGITGYSPLSFIADRSTGVDPDHAPSHQHDWKRTGQMSSDAVEEASMESFPASDAP